MSSSTLQPSIFGADRIAPSVSDIDIRDLIQVEDYLLTTRAVLAVTLLGAGVWYALWKLALYLMASN
jgi:hypothetical protein